MPSKNKKQKKKKANPLLLPMIVLTAMIAVLSVVYIVNYYGLKNKTEEDNQRLSELYNESLRKIETLQATPEPTKALPDAPDSDTVIMPYPTKPTKIDPSFEELYRINNDLVGHLMIPLKTITPIDLFVVQRDNTFYLNHDFEGKESKAGALFLDEANEIWPQDQHLIIYGHNMKNGTMFARLSRFHSIEYAKNNPILYFDTVYEKGTYAVLAAMQMPASRMLTDSFNLRTFFFGDVSFNAFMYGVHQNALYVTNIGADSDDQLLSLVTCSYDEDDERMILITRRLRENETEESIRKLIKQ